ncbi:uncharacterized protein GGS22DRAFT_179185 [Annulohypoxylon maeteangense]|uniref:uncharacterized protein n=1 Tax=Annulohypoxylon maeteangense TaxID=1927788 RepID=UPI0020088470|nr:uncharacterized protein GGS22DRAFT_179185 [Annulohypoxylon maeteangense]KAI0886283.1 hypothetical protein GGS22DRAFT_179185 [Annulohypoxylon maeteangense]
MNSFLKFTAVGLVFGLSLASGTIIPSYFERAAITKRQINLMEFQKDLGERVSYNTSIYLPFDTKFASATERYDTYAPPTIELVVVPGLESDIPIIVKWANKNSLPFLVKNRGHAMTYTIGKFKGVQIDMSGLQKIDIQPHGKTAWFQGGTWDSQVMEYLWERGYVTTTGSCGCVGMMGPGLGGGHGLYQGLYGLISDNLVNINLVRGDGSHIRVNSTSHSDLWWAMRGAGHNFGIVTSFELNIYPKRIDSWHYHNYVFTQDKLERFFDALNVFHGNGSTPVLMGLNMGGFSMNTSISKTEPIISWSFGYAGPAHDAERLLAPFNRISAAWEGSGDVPFPGISDAMNTGKNQPICAPNHTRIQSTSAIQTYNVTAERQIYNLYNETIARHPEISDSGVIHEGYSTAAVAKVDPASTAFPWRDYYLLHCFEVKLPVQVSENTLALGRLLARQIRDLWNAGAPNLKPSTYVNYAFGDESIQSIYGYEPWRLARLRVLKKKYDPKNQFSYYNPFV